MKKIHQKYMRIFVDIAFSDRGLIKKYLGKETRHFGFYRARRFGNIMGFSFLYVSLG